MWIVCYADNSHQMPSFIFSEEKKAEKHLEMYLLLVL